MNIDYSKSFVLKIFFMLVAFGGSYMLSGFYTHAQIVSDVYIATIPENPEPGEDVTVQVSSYTINVDGTLITWYENGKRVSSGIGLKSHSMKAPDSGKETTVVARLETLEDSVDVSVVIRPSVMVILWETSDSYVPPFYKGKALLTADSAVKIVAMPEIGQGSTRVNPKNMVYSWRKDYSNDQEASGYGKNYFIYTSDYLDPSSFIEVSATTVAGDKTSSGGTNIGTYQPKVLFYKVDEALGTLFENALKSGHRIVNKEVVFVAPYFISPRDLRIPRLDWSWYINDSRIINENIQPNIIPLQVESGVSGMSKLRILIEHRDKLTQTANGEIQFEF